MGVGDVVGEAVGVGDEVGVADGVGDAVGDGETLFKSIPLDFWLKIPAYG